MTIKYIPTFCDNYTSVDVDFVYRNPRIYYDGYPEIDEDPADFYAFPNVAKAVIIA